MRHRLLTLSASLLGACAAVRAQTTTTVPEGVLFPTQNSARVNGVKVQVAPDGAVWFLESSADIIARLKDGVIRQWQIRPTDQLGANPVDFELDGDVVWFIESGQSQIPSGTCAYAKLDTTTNVLTEWVVPGTIPAAFFRAPDGTVWLPQSGSVLQSLNLDTLQVTNYRSTLTYAYADMVVDGDGTFWLADFGDNRIVKWVPGAATETSWTFYPLTAGRLYPAQIEFDQNGSLWITQNAGNSVDRFDPATGNLYSYANITHPIHLDIFQGRIYVTSIAATSTLAVLDPNQAVPSQAQTLQPVTLDVGSSPSTRAATVRTTTLPAAQVFDFTSAPTTISATEFTVTNPGTAPGLLAITFPSTNAYGISVVGGRTWIGTDGQLAALNLQGVGEATDQGVPMATSLAGTADSKIRIDITVGNRGTATMTGQAFYLYSPASPTPRFSFTLGASATSLIADAFGNLSGTSTLLNGPVRLGATTTTNVDDFTATVRSLRVLPDGGTFGYLFPALSAGTSLLKDSTTTLFTGASSSDVSILNLYSLVDAKATLTLYAPDGTVRGRRDLDVAKNASLSFNPAASAFGPSLPAEPGDAVRVAVTEGSLQSSVLVFDAGTTDVLPSLPAAATTEAVLPWVGSFPNGDRSFVSDLYLSNPSVDTSADVTLTFYGIGVAPITTTLTPALAPLETRAIDDVLSALFQVSAGQGALVLSSTSPIAASVRVATQVAAGDYGTFANALDATTGWTAGESAFAIGLPQTATRTGLLLLYNAGAAGSATVTGFRADGTPAGTLTASLGDHAAAVVGPVFAELGVSNQPAGRIRLDVADGMNVFGWAAAVDTVTGDIDMTPLQ